MSDAIERVFSVSQNRFFFGQMQQCPKKREVLLTATNVLISMSNKRDNELSLVFANRLVNQIVGYVF